jgi:hypothetical protein
MNLLRPLLADAALVKIIMFVVVLAIYAINHLLSGLKKAPPGPPSRMPPPTRPADAAPRAADAPPTPARQDLNAELNEFLRRAAAKRQEAQGRAPQSAPVKAEPARPRKRKKSESSAEAAKPVEERLTQRRALPRLETSAIEARSGQLTQLSGDQFGAHVREAFDRQLGQLGAAAETSAPAQAQIPTSELQPGLAAELSALLYNPQSLRGAIILNEILARPEHRW